MGRHIFGKLLLVSMLSVSAAAFGQGGPNGCVCYDANSSPPCYDKQLGLTSGKLWGGSSSPSVVEAQCCAQDPNATVYSNAFGYTIPCGGSQD